MRERVCVQARSRNSPPHLLRHQTTGFAYAPNPALPVDQCSAALKQHTQQRRTRARTPRKAAAARPLSERLVSREPCASLAGGAVRHVVDLTAAADDAAAEAGRAQSPARKVKKEAVEEERAGLRRSARLAKRSASRL